MTKLEKYIFRCIEEIYALDDIPEIASIKNVEWKKVKVEIELVNSVVGNLCTNSVSDLDKLLTAAVITVTGKLGVDVGGRKVKKNNESFWKRRIEKKMKVWR